MASLLSHAVAGWGIGAVFPKPDQAKRAWLVAAVLAMLPDLDVVGFPLGIRYGDFWGHRGFTHSLLFAAMLAGLAVLVFFRRLARGERKLLWLCFFLTAASHGLLDAMTDGGLGVAFFSPFDTRRYFLPWRPIPVSPIGVTRFLSPRGLAVLAAELLWIWLPVALAALAAWLFRRFRIPQRKV